MQDKFPKFILCLICLCAIGLSMFMGSVQKNEKAIVEDLQDSTTKLYTKIELKEEEVKTKEQEVTALQFNEMLLSSYIEEATKKFEKLTIEEKMTKEQLAVVAEAKEKQRKITQKMVDFFTFNDNIIKIIANNRGQILYSTNTEIIGWSSKCLLGKSVNVLLPNTKKEDHTKSYSKRVKEGQSGEIVLFENKTAVSESGKRINLNGCVLWFHDEEVMVGFFYRTDNQKSIRDFRKSLGD